MKKIQLRYQISEDTEVALGFISSYYSPITVSVII